MENRGCSTCKYDYNINGISTQCSKCASNYVPIVSARVYAPKNNEIENKPKMSLIPLDILADMLCPVYAEGNEKYYRESWREGFKQSVMMDACMRHLRQFYYEREDFDPEYPEKHHLGAALFCIVSMYNSWKNFDELDDRPGGGNKKFDDLE